MYYLLKNVNKNSRFISSGLNHQNETNSNPSYIFVTFWSIYRELDYVLILDYLGFDFRT